MHKITITVDGTDRNYQWDYDDVHANDWSKIVRDMVDNVKEFNGDKF